MTMKTKAHCNRCHGDRNHDILFAEDSKWFDEESEFSGRDRYEMLRCCGCESVILRHTSSFSEDPEPSVTFYPPAMSRREPSWLPDMSGKNARFAKTLLKEIYIGLQNGMIMIATMGVRSLVEYAMIDSVGDQGSFVKNLAEFSTQGYISDKQRKILKAVLEAGHATIHRAYHPSDEDLATCLDIAESVLQTVYVHPEKAAELTKRVPKRPKAPATGG